MARPKGSLNKVNATAKSIALAALASVDQVELWRKHLLNEDPRISIAALLLPLTVMAQKGASARFRSGGLYCSSCICTQFRGFWATY
jgi:hypothetical protein